MGSLLHSGSKNSKWLQDHLRDMDAKVKAMIKLIEEDADSFARRAEMYYKKWPELMKLVKELYSAYRALAERYDHATGELRQAHKTIAAAFPNEVPFMLTDDAPLSSDLHGSVTPPLPVRDLFDAEDCDVGVGRKGLMQLNEMFRSAEVVLQTKKSAEEQLKEAMEELEKGRALALQLAQLPKENENLKTRVLDEPDRASKVEIELQNTMEAFVKTEAQRDAALLRYEQSSDKLSHLERTLNHALKDGSELDKETSKAEPEIKALKEALLRLEVEKDATLCQYKESLNQVLALETNVSAPQGDPRDLNDRVVWAETESKILNEELSRAEAEKEASCLSYKQCLEDISAQENNISLVEENARLLSEQNAGSENEVQVLKEEALTLKQEIEASALQYALCLQRVSILQKELIEAQEEARRLKGEILLGSAKLRGAKEQCALLGKGNQSLLLEANNLAQKIAVKDQKLSQKQAELEKLQNGFQDERSQFMQVEATLPSLQNLHSRSQQEHRALAIELLDGLQTLKDLEMRKQDMKAEIQQLREENRSLKDQPLSFSNSEQNLQNEITSLKAIKEKLEGEVGRQELQTGSLEQQICQLKEETGNLPKGYQDLIQQVEYVGLKPTCRQSTIKDLQEKNSRLRRSYSEDAVDKVLLKRLEHLEELLKQSSILEGSPSDISVELERSKEKIKMLQDSSLHLTAEKSALVAEKAALLSRLQTMAESMRKILEQNVVLENSLAGANAELDGLRVKSKSLEELCKLLDSERSKFLDERNNLISRLETVELKLENLEIMFAWLEDKYADLEVEKQERACLMLTSEARFSGIEDHIHDLQEENRSSKKDFDEQLDIAVQAQVEVFILQKFLQDIEEKNYYLLDARQNHVEEVKHLEKLIAELESENMMHQVEAELLLDKMAKLRTRIFQVLEALEINDTREAEMEQNCLPFIISNIKEIKSSLSGCKDENQQLVIKNSVLITMLRQFSLEHTELASRFAQELLISTKQHVMLENEKHELLERSRCLELEIAERVKRVEVLKVEMGTLQVEQGVMQMSYAKLKEEQQKEVEGNQVLLEELSDLEEEKHNLEEGINKVLLEAIHFSIQAVVWKNWGNEKALGLDSISQDRDRICEAYKNLQNKARELAADLEIKRLENLHLTESVQKLEGKQYELNFHNSKLNIQVLVQQELLDQKELELSEMHGELKSTQDVNAELSRTVKVVEKDCGDIKAASDDLVEKILEISEHCMQQGEEIKNLQDANEKLEAEVRLLNEKIEECKIREEILSSELQERNSEFELWEAEAASFYFDLQISGIKEAVFQNKVKELSGTCEDLEAVSCRKNMEIELIKEKVKTLESEVEVLRTQLAAYILVIANLKDNIASLEQTAALNENLHLDSKAQEQVADERSFSNLRDQMFSAQDGLSELQKLLNRIKLVENILMEESEGVTRSERVKASTKLLAAMKEFADLTSRINAHSEKYIHMEELVNEDRVIDHLQSPESRRETGPETSESRTGTETKDIQLDLTSECSSDGNSRRQNGQSDDQMLQLWEAIEKEYGHDLKISKSRHQTGLSEGDDILYHEYEIGEENSLNPTSDFQLKKELGVDKMELSRNVSYANQEGTMKNILERLASDANKLMGLQFAVQELRNKMKTKRRRSKDGEYDSLRDQLLEVENSVIQQVDTNTELMKSIEDRPSISDIMASMELNEAENMHRKRVWKQVQRGCDKIRRLQLEVQKMQLVLLELDDERTSRERSRFSIIRTRIPLRDFMHRNQRSRRQNKCFCGCLRPYAKEN
ncbi:hypothetical protein Dimus_001083 [Dionaea muscipula]